MLEMCFEKKGLKKIHLRNVWKDKGFVFLQK